MPAQFPVFVATTVLLLAVPGPDFVVVTRTVLTGDRRRGYRAVVGICAGLAALTLVTASGVAAVVAAHATALAVLRVVAGPTCWCWASRCSCRPGGGHAGRTRWRTRRGWSVHPWRRASSTTCSTRRR